VTTPQWEFKATCHECGESIPIVIKGGEFARKGDDLAYVVTLEGTEVEAHLLRHDVKVEP
jgi:hypothetical protein